MERVSNMKKILVTLALAVSVPAFAIDCRRGIDHKHPACYGYRHVDHRHMNHHHSPVVVYRNHDLRLWICSSSYHSTTYSGCSIYRTGLHSVD